MIKPRNKKRLKPIIKSMQKNKLKPILILCLASIFISGFTYPTSESYETELTGGNYNIMIDENNRVLQRTALPMYIGDEYIAADNKHYRVTRVSGNTAYSKYIGTEDIAWKEEWDVLAAASQANKQPLKIAIYHTHSDESYVPTDGTFTIPGNGGIYRVGSVFTKKLTKLKYEVLHSFKTHDPHDANAYQRSRRTAVDLLKQKPDALIDVHRDAVPPDVYRSNIKGKEVTKIKLVVGRRNPTMKNNLEFAKILKAAMDKTNPGLFEGIFLARGSYNQELSPRAILVEVGAHTNSRYEAQNGVDLFGEALPKAIGVTEINYKEPATKSQTNAKDNLPVKLAANQNKTSWRSATWLILFVLVGGFAFLMLSTGSWERTKNALGKEWGKGKK